MTQSGLVIDRDRSGIAGIARPSGFRPGQDGERERERERERAARNTLRTQIGRLERECSAIVADTFPHISPAAFPQISPSELPHASPAEPRAVKGGVAAGSPEAIGGPCLLTLAELERMRDRLAGRAQDLRRLAASRVEHERASRELLERIKLEPGHYKFARLPVRDLGQGGCGVWEVRPRLGLIGMLAGWWHVKLSSGCPLPKGPRTARPRTPHATERLTLAP